MKKILLSIILLSKLSLFNEDNLDYENLARRHFRALNSINSSSNILFAKILALEIGKQFSNSDSDLNQDLLLFGSKLRQQIEKVLIDFAYDFKLN